MSYDSDVVSATGGVGEADWDKIIKLCNRIRDSVGPTSMHQAMQSVMRRVKLNSSPNVQLHALTLLEACVSNCGQGFQKELATPGFQSEVKSILIGPYSDPRVSQRLKELLASWTVEFKSAPHMKDLLKFVDQLRREGVNFTQAPTPATTQNTPSPVQATRAREEEDLRKAIQLSLQENKSTPPPSSSSSTSASSSARPAKKEVSRKVRAIYDFQAAEDNELSFRAGEIITLLDDADENWWRGETQLSQGLFPASFVSKNLNVDPEPSKHEKKKKTQTKSGGGVVKEGGRVAGDTVGRGGKGGVNESKVDLLLDMLKSADVTDTSREESKTVKELEIEVQEMRPRVEQSLQQLTVQEDGMQNVSTQFHEALALYRKLLAEGPRLSDTVQPPVTQSHSHAMQHGMTTQEAHVVNHVLQTQYEVGTHLQQNGTQIQSGQPVYQPSVQPQHGGMGMPMQHGMGTQVQSGLGAQSSPQVMQQPYQIGIGTQPGVMTGMGVPQNGIGVPPQNGMGAQHQSTVYSSNPGPGRYAPNEMPGGGMSLQLAPGLQYQPQQPLSLQPTQQQQHQQQQQQHQQQQQQQQHSSYGPPSYQQPVTFPPLSQPPLSLPTSTLPPPYHPHTTQLVRQPLL